MVASTDSICLVCLCCNKMTGRSFCRTLLACYNGRWGITVSEIGKKDLLTFQDIAKPIEQ